MNPYREEYKRFSRNPLQLLCAPEVKDLIGIIRESYVPSGDILLILPCSARKPYGSSPTQRLYWKAARQAVPEKTSIERATLSGVYGIVPSSFEDQVIGYDFNLNRSSYTRGMHKEIMELLAQRVHNFLARHGSSFKAVIFYGRERYRQTMQMAALLLQADNLWLLPRNGAPLKKEGLDELRTVLRQLSSKF